MPVVGAPGETRTPTPLPETDFEFAASTDSATGAGFDVTLRPSPVNSRSWERVAVSKCGGYMKAMQHSPPITLAGFEPARLWLLAALLASAGALALALVGQFAFGLQPCILCLYERIPYLCVAFVALIGIVLPLGERQRRRLLVFAGLMFAGGAGLAVYHVGIEQHWWTSSIPGCVGAPVQTMSVEDLRASILVPLRSCDQVDWRLFGLTLAGWNAIASCHSRRSLPLARRPTSEKEPQMSADLGKPKPHAGRW